MKEGTVGRFLQDHWDNRRENVVNRNVPVPNLKTAIEKFCDRVENACHVMRSMPRDKQIIHIAYSPFDIGNHDDNDKTFSDELAKFQNAVNTHKNHRLNKHADTCKVRLETMGSRTTGMIVFDDGTSEVCDPLKGVRINGRKMECMKPILTFYAVITLPEFPL